MTRSGTISILALYLATIPLTASAQVPHDQGLPLAPVESAGITVLPAATATDASARPGITQPFVDTLADIRNLPSWQNMAWVVAGLGLAAAVQPADTAISREFAATRTVPFKPGAFVGATPLELGGAFAAFAIGRATNKPRVMSLGRDLIRAQLLAELMTIGVKQSVRRSRPDGGRFSFPSGHTAVSFASATVLQQHFGWRAGLPAYAVASYVAASRVHMKRHHLSDIAFGATVGIVAGRTVSLGGGRKAVISPIAAAGGGGIALTWLGKQ